MSPVIRAWLFMGLIQHETARKVLEPIARRLRTGRCTDTVDRLFESKHVNDLRLIAAVASIVVVWVAIFSAVFAFDGALMYARSNPDLQGLTLVGDLLIAGVEDFLKLFAPAMVVFGAILAWAYQTGSARLGVVDLFACEIDTLCRMTTIVDMVGRQVALFNAGPPATSPGQDCSGLAVGQFVSQENYFPVFDSNSRDLQTLEARVVIHITAFYTYMKAVRDSLRKVAEVRATAVESHRPPDEAAAAGPWHDSLRNVLYMLYLGLESARKAIHDLVEFEPEQAERKIVILISELKAYRFLRGQYSNPLDMRYHRLILRASEYEREVDALCVMVEKQRKRVYGDGAPEESRDDADDEQLWLAAFQLLGELKQQYADLTQQAVACGDSLFGNVTRHEPCRCDVESGIARRGVGDSDRDDMSVLVPAVDQGDLVGRALFDRNLAARGDRAIEGGKR